MALKCINVKIILVVIRYCKQCGTKSSEDKVRKIKCPDCGNMIGNSDFCGNCGSRLTRDLFYVINNQIQNCPKCSNKIIWMLNSVKIVVRRL